MRPVKNLRSLALPVIVALAIGGTTAGAAAGNSPPGPTRAVSGDSASGPSGPSGLAAPGDRWKKINSGSVSNTIQPTMEFGDDGRLHIVSKYEVGGTQDFYEQVLASSTGRILGRTNVLGPWVALDSDPTLVKAPTGDLHLSFSGLDGGPTGSFFGDGYGYFTTSNATGEVWTLQNAATVKTKAYASTGSSATFLPDGTPVTSGAQIGGLWWRAGTIASASVTTAIDDNKIAWNCCAYGTALARSGDEVYLGWYSNADDRPGIYAQRILPTVGPLLKAPKSSDSAGNIVQPLRAVSMVARPGGGVVMAYCVGYPTCKYIGEWEVGTSRVYKVPGSKGVTSIALDSADDGRLWTTWIDPQDNVRGVRSSTRGFRYGEVVETPHPRGEDTLYSIASEGSRPTVDIVVNSGDGLYYRQLRAGLTLKASPSRLQAGRPTKVKFRVLDSDEKVSGAKVKVAGKTCRTNGSGKCKIRLPGQSPRKLKAIAKKRGYSDGSTKLRVQK